MRPTELAPQVLIDELLRLAKIDRDWTVWNRVDGNHFRTVIRHSTPVRSIAKHGGELLGMKGLSIWLLDGPKVFRPTAEQCLAMEHVSVNLRIEDYSQPFPALLVVVPYPPFTSVLCYHEPGMLAAGLFSPGSSKDIVTIVGLHDGDVEESLVRFDEECQVDAETAARALRVACNSCLALSHYGCHLDYLFPKEVERDRRLAGERSERGERARRRLALTVRTISFDREVRVHRTAAPREAGPPTGREMPTHWRRGHWAMQPCGPQHSERRRILRQPVLVRSDLLDGERSETTTTYKT